jgi:hypothetical protein
MINAPSIELLSLGFTAFYHRVRDLQAIFSKNLIILIYEQRHDD